MNLRSVDLNLLVILEALVIEKQVTRAAKTVGLSQPAVSAALNRLRIIFRDDLLVRTPKGMEPTPRAMELANEIGQVLRDVQRIFESNLTFDPRSSRRQVSIRMSDLLAFLLLPQLARRFETSAPHVTFRILNMSPTESVSALLSDQIDYAVSTGLNHPRAIGSETLFKDRLVCVVREGHSISGKQISLDDFMALRHLKISSSPIDSRFVDHALSERRLEREVAMHLPNWMVAPAVLAQTDLGLVIPERLARSFDNRQLRILLMPFAPMHFEWRLYWNKRHERTPAHSWFLEQFRQASGAA